MSCAVCTILQPHIMCLIFIKYPPLYISAPVSLMCGESPLTGWAWVGNPILNAKPTLINRHPIASKRCRIVGSRKYRDGLSQALSPFWNSEQVLGGETNREQRVVQMVCGQNLPVETTFDHFASLIWTSELWIELAFHEMLKPNLLHASASLKSGSQIVHVAKLSYFGYWTHFCHIARVVHRLLDAERIMTLWFVWTYMQSSVSGWSMPAWYLRIKQMPLKWRNLWLWAHRHRT